MDTKERARTCPGCGMAMQEGQRICPGCGKTRRPSGWVRCRHCGTMNRSIRTTCAACGEPLRRVPGWVLLAATPALATILAVLGWIVLPRLLTGPGRPGVLPTAPLQAVTVATSTPVPTSLPTLPPSRTPLPAATSTSTPSATATPTATHTPTATATESPTPSRTPSRTPTPTLTASATPTSTATPTLTATATPTPTEALTSEPSPSPTPFIYTVKSGDNLYTIAQTFGVTVEAIMEANSLTSNSLRVGQQLIIPLSTPTPTITPTP